MEKALSPNVHNDFDWLEYELAHGASGGKYLVGNDLTIADITMGFSVEFILKRKLGTEGGNWPHVEKWFEGVTQRAAYKKAVEKSGYSL